MIRCSINSAPALNLQICYGPRVSARRRYWPRVASDFANRSARKQSSLLRFPARNLRPIHGVFHLLESMTFPKARLTWALQRHSFSPLCLLSPLILTLFLLGCASAQTAKDAASLNP